MRLITSPLNYEQAKTLLIKKQCSVILANDQFAKYTTYNFSIEEIKALSENKKDNEIFILVNKIFFESELETLEHYLLDIAKMPIDGIIFHDFAIMWIANKYPELFKNFKFIYNPETLVTSYYQFDFYQQAKIDGAFIAREIFEPELKEIIVNKKTFITMMQIHGLCYIMYSYWDLISNFANKDNLEIKTKKNFFDLQENKRKIDNLIYENNNGTFLFTKYAMAMLNKINQYYNCDYGYIESFNMSIDELDQIVEIYHKALNDKKDLSLDYLNKISPRTYTNHFYGPVDGILNFRGKDDE